MLSILIPSIPEREKTLTILLKELEKQIDYCAKIHAMLGEVEVVIDNSKKYLEGGLSIGEKRNSLLNRATKKYICFLDDDEGIAPDYVETLLRLCERGNDVCTFKSLFKCDTYWTVIDMGLNNPNEEATPEKEVKRNAWHVCPIRRSIAIKYQFSSLNHNEDWEWMRRVLKDIKTEAKTNKIIHNYNHFKAVSEADRILNENTTN
jgi:glycosyltransferase involved in cell wall biosynthesis